MIMIWIKFIHVAGIALWSAGLIALPFLFRQRRGLAGQRLHELHSFTRFFYINLVSPAAFVSVASGTALILMQETYSNWFYAKLVGVSAMTGIHIFSGLAILTIFERTGQYHTGRFLLAVPLTIVVVGAILALVLGKPEMDWPAPIDSFFAPGALSDWTAWITGGWK